MHSTVPKFLDVLRIIIIFFFCTKIGISQFQYVRKAVPRTVCGKWEFKWCGCALSFRFHCIRSTWEMFHQRSALLLDILKCIPRPVSKLLGLVVSVVVMKIAVHNLQKEIQWNTSICIQNISITSSLHIRAREAGGWLCGVGGGEGVAWKWLRARKDLTSKDFLQNKRHNF